MEESQSASHAENLTLPGQWVGSIVSQSPKSSLCSRLQTQLLGGTRIAVSATREPQHQNPPALLLPRETGSLQISLNGSAVSRTPDAEGRVWLQQAQASDSLTISTAHTLRWYQDRFADEITPVWLVSMPVMAYRLLMLA